MVEEARWAHGLGTKLAALAALSALGCSSSSPPTSTPGHNAGDAGSDSSTPADSGTSNEDAAEEATHDAPSPADAFTSGDAGSSPDGATEAAPDATDVLEGGGDAATDASSSSCGNSVVDPGEQCDPPGPGSCSATCQFIFSDRPPNGTCATANAFTNVGNGGTPWYAHITATDPIEYFSFDVPGSTVGIDVDVDDNGDGDCHNEVIVAEAQLIAPDCTTVIASSNGTSSDYCPAIMASPSGPTFAAGTYYVRVSAGPLEPSATFAYRLRIYLQP